MLFADKQQLQHQLEVDLLTLRQKELDHFTTCCLTLASPAALIAGFAYSGIAEVEIPEDVHWATEGLYYVMTVSAMLFQVAATVRASLVALMGPALALRGKAGSMHRSVEAMEPCFRGAWRLFLAGMFCMLMSTLINVFQQSQYWASATFVGVGICLATIEIYRDIRYVSLRFSLPANQVERGAFTRQEVASMFKGRRLNDKRRPRALPRSVTTSILIQAAEGAPLADPKLHGLTRQSTRDVDERTPKRRPGSSLKEFLAGRSFASAASPRASSVANSPRASGGSTSLALSPRKAAALAALDDEATGTQPPAQRAALADGATPNRPAAPSGGPHVSFALSTRRGRASADAQDAGARAASAGCGKRQASMRRFSCGLGAVAAPLPAQPAGAGLSASPRSGAAASGAEPLTEESTVNVVLTVRDGKRLRWQVPARTSIAQLRTQAEGYFRMEIEALLDAHAAMFANPSEEQVLRHATVSGGERVAFFEVVPKASAGVAQSSFLRMIWTNFLGRI